MSTARRPLDGRSDARRVLEAHIQKNLGQGLGLGSYLRRIAQASAMAAMLGACGMSHTGTPDAGGDTSTPPPDSSVPDSDVPDVLVPPDTAPPPPPPADLCSADGVYQIVHGLNAEVSATWTGAMWGGDFRGPAYIDDEIGERCGDARAPDECLATIDRIVGETYQRGVITSSGDAVVTYLTREEVGAFLGAIDTPKDAALLVWHAGYDIQCSGDFTSSVTRVEDGWSVVAYRSGGGCGSPWVTTRYTIGVYDGEIVEEDAVVVAEEEGFGCIGRRPAGLAGDMRAVTTGACLGDYFANIARLEESAVAAFDLMISELEGLGAPAALVDAAWAARQDEVRHTESMSSLATSFGAAPLSPNVEAVAARTPYEIALENAVEGCVRETFGALVGAHQALSAQNPRVARAMGEVAEDEIRHAELSWAVAGWLEPQLTSEERERIAEAKRDAIMMLRQQAAEPVDPELVAQAGVPDPDTAVRMVERLAADIWA